MKNIILTLVAALSLFSFSTFAGNKSKFAVSNHTSKVSAKTQMLVDFMESQFSGVSKNDGNNLALSSTPIWKNNKAAAGKWIYTEQASTENLAHPFRQNIYNIAQINDSTFVTAVYNVPQASKFVGAWQNGDMLASLNPTELDFKKDCQVFLVFYKNNQMQLGNGTIPAKDIISLNGSTLTKSNPSTKITNVNTVVNCEAAIDQ